MSFSLAVSGFGGVEEGSFGNMGMERVLGKKRRDGTLCRHVPWRRPHAGNPCLLLLIICYLFIFLFPPEFVIGTAFARVGS